MTLSRLVPTGKDATLNTEAWGEPTKGTILLIMGATASMAWWPDSLMQALAGGGYRAIRFDHRDTGASTTLPPGEGNYDLGDLEGDVTAILDAYGVSRAHLVGMSLGGYVGQIVAMRQSQRVQSLTLIASEPVNIPYESEGISEAFMAHFGTMATLDWTNDGTVSAFLLRIAELSAGSAVTFDPAPVKRRIATELARSNSIASAFNHAGVGGDTDGLDLGTLRLPTLVIHGSEDPIISVNAGRAIAAAIPGSRLMVLDGRGHELLEQDMPAIAAAILELAERSASGVR